MPSEFDPAINRLQQEIESKEAEISALKQTINQLCGYAGRPALYLNTDTVASITNIRRDQFFGVPLATAVKDYLKMRGDPKSGGLGAATVNEIFSALVDGGFAFEARNDENAKRGLRISLSKNVASFTKVPGGGEGAFGLSDWYPAAKAHRNDGAEKQTAPEPKEEQGPNEFSDESDTYHSDDTSKPPLDESEEA